MKKVANIDKLVKENLDSSFQLSENFTHIRGYHGCRPLNLKTYYNNGIKNLTKEEILSETLLRLENPFTPKEKIIEAFNNTFKKIDNDEGIWFTVSKEELLTTSGHYMIYGSEIIQEIAANLSLHDFLKQRGIPTIFLIDIPIEKISRFWLEELEKNIRNKYSFGGYKTTCAISPDEIVNHYHPNKIKDWHNGGRNYFFPV